MSGNHQSNHCREPQALRCSLAELKKLRGAVWVLFWEVTNLGARIFDTEDLSIIRGGSTMADVFARSAASELCPDGVVVVYAAASQVLAASSSKKAVESFGRALQERFKRDPWRGTSGWAVGKLDNVSSPKAAWLQARLITQIHLDSRQRLEIDHGRPCAQGGPGDVAGRVDPLDRIHGVAPASVSPVLTTRAANKAKKLPLSIANTFRFRFGQRHRYGLVARLDEALDKDAIPELQHLPRTLEQWEEVAKTYPKGHQGGKRDQTFAGLVEGGSMPSYMAVIEADGVSFSDWRGQHTTLEAIARASHAMALAIERALAAAIDRELVKMRAELGKLGTALLAQLLVCAGDEWVLVTRGERAFQVMESYAAAWTKAATEAENACFDRPPPKRLADRPWRMAAVVVNHKTPIRHVREAVKELLSNLKSAEDTLGTQGFRMDWAVLKSHDVPPEGVLAHREATFKGHTRRLCGSYSKTNVPEKVREGTITRADKLGELLGIARRLRAGGFPARQLKRRALADVRGLAAPPWSQDALKLLGGGISDVLDRSGELASAWPDLAEMMEVVSCEINHKLPGGESR